MSDELNGHSVCLVCLDDEDLIFSLMYNPMTTANTVRSSKNNTKKAKRALDGLRVSNSGNAPKECLPYRFRCLKTHSIFQPSARVAVLFPRLFSSPSGQV